jgi:Uma2 family endonuclease
MGVMRAPEVPEVWADPNRMLTVEDLEDMPDDEYRYELDDGVLIVSPAPSNRHQLVVSRLQMVLGAACPPEFLVLTGPGVNVNRFQHRVPDVAVIRTESFEQMYQVEPPVLAIEVASPRTRLYDLGRKKEVYERFGVRSYWIVDPDGERPSLTVFELRRGRYAQMAQATGKEAFEAARPFPVTIVPADLVTVVSS